MEYGMWRACERFGIRPPGVEKTWDECHAWIQAMLLSYDQVRQHEEVEWEAELAKAGRRL